MEAYGRKCPDQFINNLTPMEFDELVVMFNKYDVSKSLNSLLRGDWV